MQNRIGLTFGFVVENIKYQIDYLCSFDAVVHANNVTLEYDLRDANEIISFFAVRSYE